MVVKPREDVGGSCLQRERWKHAVDGQEGQVGGLEARAIGKPNANAVGDGLLGDTRGVRGNEMAGAAGIGNGLRGSESTSDVIGNTI